MAYRTILVHVDQTAPAETRIRLATRLALREDAHLVGAARSGVPRFMYACDPFDTTGEIIADYLALAGKRAAAAKRPWQCSAPNQAVTPMAKNPAPISRCSWPATASRSRCCASRTR